MLELMCNIQMESMKRKIADRKERWDENFRIRAGQEMGALKPSGGKTNGMSREKKQAKTKKVFDWFTVKLVSMFLTY